MAEMNILFTNNNNENRTVVTHTSHFSGSINDALENCQHARNLYRTMSNETGELSRSASSSVRNYCSIGLHVNNALEGSIRAIGHGANMVNHLRTMLNTEQRGALANDIHGMQSGLITTYTGCIAAENELFDSLRQTVEDDPLLRDDVLAIQCVDAIEDQRNHLQSLPITNESQRERSDTIQSMQSQLNLLEERVEHINPKSPLAKFLKIFRKAFEAMNHTIKSVIKSLCDTLT